MAHEEENDALRRDAAKRLASAADTGKREPDAACAGAAAEVVGARIKARREAAEFTGR